MTSFKSFNPKKYSKHSRYKAGGGYYHSSQLSNLKELCANCGYSNGMHWGNGIDACPNPELNKQHYPKERVVKPVKILRSYLNKKNAVKN